LDGIDSIALNRPCTKNVRAVAGKPEDAVILWSRVQIQARNARAQASDLCALGDHSLALRALRACTNAACLQKKWGRGSCQSAVQSATQRELRPPEKIQRLFDQPL